MNMNLSISIVIRTKNEAEHLGRVLDGLKGQQLGNVEIILVDSGSTDETLKIAQTFGCRIMKIKPEEFSFGMALNLGIEHSKGEIIVFLSGHSIPVDGNFLTHLIAPYRDPSVVATFGRNVPLPDACPSEAKDIETWYPDEWIDAPERFSNGNASLRRTAWEIVPFDEKVSGSEDILWAKEMVRLGYHIIYVPSAAVYHSHTASLKYAFVRRFRETKAMVENGQDIAMSFQEFLRWTLCLSIADLQYARRRNYSLVWYIHVPLFRAAQGLAIYYAVRGRLPQRPSSLENTGVAKKRFLSFKTRIVAYSQKSRRVIREQGWKVFFSKAKRKIIFKLRLVCPPAENRVLPAPLVRRFPTARRFMVMFIVDPVGILTNHYRADNVKEYLGVAGIECAVAPETRLDLPWITSFDLVVLCRVFMNPHIEKLIQICRANSIPVIFDADDFIIDPTVIDHIAALEGIAEEEKHLHVEALRKHRGTFDAADFFIAPTDSLAEAGKNLGKTSFVLRNGVDSAQVDLASTILAAGPSLRGSDVIRIGYFSGTKSHQKDFSVAVPALLRILRDFPFVHLYVGGYLDLDGRLDEFRDRIKKLPFVEMEKLPYNIAKVDINIAPLEVGNPFCEAKSELKYFDAGLLRIPTVASPTNAFRWAIRHGHNGLLASSTEEWYCCLKSLIEDADLRKLMGRRAYDHVMEHYSSGSKSFSTRKVFEDIISRYREQRGIPDNALKVSFVVPPPLEGSGGHNKILAAAKYLSELGHSVTLHFLNDGTFAGVEELKGFLLDHFVDPRCDIVLGSDTIFSCDILCATSWTTAYVVRDHKAKAASLFYFVQDMEHLFFPMSDEYLKAENTYRLGLYHISYGPWCAKVIRERYEGRAGHIPFSLDKRIYYPRREERARGGGVVFFARPEMPRRCFRLGIEALSIFHERNPEVKITLFGSRQIAGWTIPFPHENLGVLDTGELAELYSRADLGLAFSTTNPSLVPFEMMACGCPVIDLDYNDNYINYGSRENVKLVGISPEEIAEGIEEMIKNDELRLYVAENGLRFAEGFPDDKEAFKAMDDIFMSAFGLKTHSAGSVISDVLTEET